LKLADFFGEEDVFFAYGNERVGNDDFELELEETKSIKNTRKPLRTELVGPKPKMPTKSHNDTFVYIEENMLGSFKAETLPIELQNLYLLGSVIGNKKLHIHILSFRMMIFLSF
jgi:doublecortin-like kinase 1/2